MAEFTTMTLECKCTRMTRLYRSVYDTEPSTTLLPQNAVFYSRKQYRNATVELFYISEGMNQSSVPVGYWCPAGSVQVHPVFDEKKQFIIPTSKEESEEIVHSDGSKAEFTKLFVKSEGVRVYETLDSSEAINSSLRAGDYLLADRSYMYVNNAGVEEQRYRIRLTTSEDQTVLGMWVGVDRKLVAPEGASVWMRSPYVSAKPANFNEDMLSALADNGISLLADGDGTSSGEGGNFLTSFINKVFAFGSNDTEKTEVSVPSFDVTEAGQSYTSDVAINSLDAQSEMADLYAAYGYDYTAGTSSSLMGVPVGSMIFVHGMPFQYTAITDRRDSTSMGNGYTGESSADSNPATGSGGVKSGDTDTYGRTFAKEIAANMPICVIAPGKPKFLTSVKDGLGGYVSEVVSDIRNTFMPMFSAQSDTEFGSILANLNDIQGDFQYYSMEIDTAKYFKYVNSCCRSAAYLMGLSSVQYHGKKCPDLDWGDYNTAAEQDFSVFEQVMGLSQGVSFAYDPQSSVSDTISNTTTESQFMSMFNDVSSKARELEFITGYSGLDTGDLFDSTNYRQQATTQLNTGAFAGLQNVVDRIGTWMNNSIHGMNMRFPEIWSDSTNSRSYEIDMHFVAPYATSFCKWRYVLVPFFHIFCAAAPRSDAHVSQYSAPFLIRAYSKGYFNVEMGIIESLTWKRFGDGNMISEDGVPTQIDVTVGFKDLYHTLAMTEFYGEGLATNVGNFMNNTGLIDLIGTLSGVNMNRITLGERLAMFASTSMNALGSMGSNFMRDVSTKFRNISDRLHLYGV